jgi:TonB-linked SusC/RagA family outer membrane protein
MTIMNLKKLVKSIFYVCFLLFSTAALAQTKVVTGKVTDAKDGSGVPNASVLVKGTKQGTQTEADGTFKLTVAQNATTLTISSIGFTTLDVSIVGKSSVNVALSAAASEQLNDVVVIGYGTARKKDLTGAVASLSAKSFNQGAIAAPDQLLQSKIAGVLVTTNSGEPGAGTTVQVRGNSSIRANNNPLYVVDGVPLDGRSGEPVVSVTGFGSVPASNPLLYINPNDIASIDVLKDASASAIYGSRGANGVIMVTTKKATAGAMKVDVGVSYGAFAGYMKRFGILDAGGYVSALANYKARNSTIAALIPDSIQMINDNGAKVGYKNNGGYSVDPLKDITSNTISQSYSVALSGGNENGRYRASFLANNAEGFIKGTGLQKYIGSFAGTTYLLDKRLTLDFNLVAGNVGHRFGAITNTPGSAGNLMTAALQWNPTQPYRDASGYYQFPASGSGNPLALIDGINDKAITNTILGNISANYKLTKGLEYKFLYAINHSAGTRNVNYAGWLQGYTSISGSGLGVISNALINSQTFTHTLNYNVDLTAKLHLTALGGYEYWKTDYSTSYTQGTLFNTNQTQKTIIAIPYTSMMQNASTISTGSSADPTVELQSFFGRAIFNYADKYIFTGTVRRDGSSKFGANNKYGTFPSLAAKWVINNESFMKGNKLFSTLALRASWGINGNQEFPAGAALEQFTFTSYNNAGQVNVANPDLKWEQTKSTNIGLEFSLLKGRLFGSFDWYNKNTSNLLYQSAAIQPAPAAYSFTNINANLINKGIELSLGYALIDKKDLGVDISANYSYNKNQLTNFNQALIITGAVNGAGLSGSFAEAIANNQPLSVYYLKHFTGYDASGNQVLSANPAFAGDPNPHSFYGISTTLRYKKFDLILNGGGSGGFLIYNNTATGITNVYNMTKGLNIDKNALNSIESPSSAAAASDRFLEKGNYFKLRNATVRYRVGALGKYVKNLTAYITGNNLLVITKFSGFDPEVSIDKSNNNYPSRSMEYAPYPTSRTIVFGLNFSL